MSLDNKNKKPFSLLKNKKFIILMFVRIVTGLSFGMYLLGETWFVVNELNMKSYLGIVLMVTSVPRLILMIYGGIISDQYSRTKIMFFSLSFRGILVFILVWILATDNLTFSLLLLFAFAFGVFSALFYPANSALTPKIVKKEELTRANSLLQSTNLISTIIGPIVAGLLLAKGSFELLFSITATLLLIGGICVYFLKVSSNLSLGQKESLYESIKSAVLFIKNDSLLFSLLIIICVVNLFIVGPVNIALPILVEEKLSSRALDYSYLQSGMLFGLMLGTILISITNIRSKRGKIILFSIITSGISVFSLAFIANLLQGLLVLIVYGLCISVSSIIVALIQENTPSDKMGRVMGLTSTASLGLTPLSYGLTSLALFLNISINHLLIYCGVIVIIIAALVTWKASAIKLID